MSTRTSTPRLGSTTVQIKAGGDRWRKTATIIYGYLRREMSDAESERKRVYPRTWDTQIQRTVALTWRMARELATLYLHSVDRTLVDDDGKPIGDEEIKAMRREYKRAKIDRRMRTAQEQYSALQNATVWVWLTSTGYRILTPPIHDQWAFSGRVDGQEVDDIVEWRVRFPVVTDPFATSVPTATALITKTRAIWESGPAGWAGTGIWAKDGSNPFGRIPVVYLRGCDPAPGEFFVPVPEDSVDAARAVNHDYTMMGDVGRKQAYAQAVAKGLTQVQANDIEVGPESVVGIPDNGSFTYESPKPELAAFGGQLDSFIKIVIACTGLSPATVMNSTGITALSKIVENVAQDVERQRARDEFESGEQQLYELIQLATEIRNGGIATLPKGAQMAVTYREPKMPVDPVNDASAKKQRIEMLIDCAASIIAAEKAIPIEQAQELAKKNLELQRELGALPPEFDETKGATTTPPPADPVETQTPTPDAGEVTVTPPPPGTDIQKEALNGAQMDSMKGIVTEATNGLISARSARAMLQAGLPSIDVSLIDEMLADVGTFKPQVAGAPPPPPEAAA